MAACTSCGNQIPDDNAVFCPTCGARLVPTGTPGPPSAAPPPPQPSVTPATSGLAIVSLVCGLLFFIFPSAVAAIIFGHISRSDIRRGGGRKSGAGMAMAGLILGYLGVAIIPIVLIVAAIAIPNLLRAKIFANEASTVGSLRTLNEAVLLYSNSYGKLPAELSSLGPAASGAAASENAADLVDSVLADGRKSGYVFRYQSIPAADSGGAAGYGAFTITADPVSPGSTGVRHYYTDQTGVIRVEANRTATAESPPII